MPADTKAARTKNVLSNAWTADAPCMDECRDSHAQAALLCGSKAPLLVTEHSSIEGTCEEAWIQTEGPEAGMEAFERRLGRPWRGIRWGGEKISSKTLKNLALHP